MGRSSVSNDDSTLGGLQSDPERKSALLTKAQRAYLRGEKNYSQQGESSAKGRIRGRLRAGMHDLVLLARALPESEVYRVFGHGATDDGYQPARAWPLFAFGYTTRTDSATPAGADGTRASYTTLSRRVDSLAREVEIGVSNAMAAREQLAPSEVGCEIELGERSVSLPADAEDLAKIDREQIDNLYATGEIDSDEYAEAMRIRLQRGER